MTRTELTDDAVLAAMQQILVNGEYPSLARVRAVLDSTASQQTLQRRMHEQWTVIGRQLATGQPLDLPDRVAHAARAMWREASDAAHDNLQRERHEHEKRDRERQHELVEACGKLEGALDNAAQLDALLDQKQAKLAETQEELASTQERLRELEQRYGELEAKSKTDRKQAADQLRHVRHTGRTQIAQAQAERERLTEALRLSQERMESQQVAWAKQIEEARQGESAARAETQAVRDKATAEIQSVMNARDTALERAQAVSNENQGLQKSLSTAENERDRVTGSLEKTQSRLDAMDSHAQDLERSLAERVAETGIAQALADERQTTISMLTEELRLAREAPRKRTPRKKS